MNSESYKYWSWPLFSLILALGIIISSVIVIVGIENIKTKQGSITVTGSAKKQIKSDLVVWRGTYSAQAEEMSDAYAMLKRESESVKRYILNKGIDEKSMVFNSIITSPNYIVLPNGQYTNKIESYKLIQNVEVRSNDVDKITLLSRESTELINSGIEFQSNPPEYFYTKIADLKVDMLSLATKDAMTRAEQIAKSTGSKVGKLKAARMGVFQITPLYSTEVTDSGMNDTTSIDKEITAVMTCEFQIK